MVAWVILQIIDWANCYQWDLPIFFAVCPPNTTQPLNQNTTNGLAPADQHKSAEIHFYMFIYALVMAVIIFGMWLCCYYIPKKVNECLVYREQRQIKEERQIKKQRQSQDVQEYGAILPIRRLMSELSLDQRITASELMEDIAMEPGRINHGENQTYGNGIRRLTSHPKQKHIKSN